MTRAELLEARIIISVGRSFAVVDPIDYEKMRQQEWKLAKRSNDKLYAYFDYKNEVGFQRWYLHHAICTRAHGPRPSPLYACEAINGDSLDCRRENLRWTLKLALKLAAMRAGKAAKAAANA